jgi:hypothetical protein
MKKFPIALLALLPLCLLTGCFDTQEEFTVNPDGSGKVKVDSVCAPFEMNMDGDEAKKTPEQKLLASVKNLLENIKGVAAWKDVSYERKDDGRLKFKGTAYFADLGKLDLNMMALMQFELVKTNGVLALTSRMNGNDDAKKKKTKEPVAEADIPAKMKEARAGYQSSKPMLLGMIGPARQDAVFHLPGAVSQVTNFRQVGADLQIGFAGTNLLATMEALVMDNAWLRQQIADGNDVMKDGMGDSDNVVNEKLFGQKAPIRAVIKPGAALFDYAAELAAAKKEYAALNRKLDAAASAKPHADGTPTEPPANGGDFKSLKVGGVQRVFGNGGKEEEDFQMRPFHGSPGLILAIAGELPGAVLAMQAGKLEVATGADGSDLLPEKDWDRKINFPSLGKGNSRVMFEVKLNEPGAGVKGFKEISGTLNYTVASGTTNVDLGFVELKAGATGTAFASKIKTIGSSRRHQGGAEIEVEFNISRDEIVDSRLVQADGTETVLEQGSSWGSDGKASITFESKEALPASARLVLKLHAGIKRFEIPFKLTDLDLMGQPVR